MRRKRKPKFDLEYIVHWLIAISIVLGVVGMILQFYRFGGLVEPGSIGPTGF